MAYVAQQAWIINDTVENNVLLGQELDQGKWDRVVKARLSLLCPLVAWSKLAASILRLVVELAPELMCNKQHVPLVRRATLFCSGAHCVGGCAGLLPGG